MNFGETGSLLRLFAQTSDAGERNRILSALLTEHAEPIISKIIRYKTRGAQDDGEEIYSEVMLQLVGRLRRLRIYSKHARRRRRSFGRFGFDG